MSEEFPRQPIRAVEIREVADGIAVFVEDVQVASSGSRYSFDLSLGEPRNAIWRVTPEAPFSYNFKIIKEDEVN